MYCTIRMRLEADSTRIKEIRESLSDIHRTPESLIGYLEGVPVEIRGLNAAVFNPSLTKIYLGNNVQNMEPTDIPLAIENLTTRLPILAQAPISRIDISATFKTAQDPSAYIHSLGPLPRLRKVKDYIRGTNEIAVSEKGRLQSRYYMGGAMTAFFYDKGAQVMEEEDGWPDGVSKGNYLRYELRIKRWLKRRIGWKSKNPILLSDLKRPGLQRRLLDMWYTAYSRVVKLDPCLDFSLLTGEGSPINELAAMAYMAGSPIEIEQHFRRKWTLAGVPRTTQTNRIASLRRVAKDSMEMRSMCQTRPIDELDTLVGNFYDHWIQSLADLPAEDLEPLSDPIEWGFEDEDPSDSLESDQAQDEPANDDQVKDDD